MPQARSRSTTKSPTVLAMDEPPRQGSYLTRSRHGPTRRLPSRRKNGQHPSPSRARRRKRVATFGRCGKPHPSTAKILRLAASPGPEPRENGMSSLFKPSSNTAFRAALVTLALLFGGGLIAGPMMYVRTPFFTQQQDPFNHSIHVKQGVGCVTCHGRVDEMAQVEKARSLAMGWCLECHRHPERFLRPRDQITSMTYKPKEDQLAIGKQLKEQYHVETRTSCTTCHR